MLRHNLWITLLLIVFVQLSSDYVGSSSLIKVSSKCSRSIRNRMEDFDLRLASLLLSSPKNENVIISPINILTSLALIHLGSDGSTRLQLNRILGLPKTRMIVKLHRTIRKIFRIGKEHLKDSFTPAFTSVKAIFVDNLIAVKGKFRALSKSIYDSEITKVDFSHPSTSTKIANEYMAKKTKNRIPTLFGHTLAEKTSILISSYAHFEAEWELKFNTIHTIKRLFYLSPVQTIMVDSIWRIQSFYEPIQYADIIDFKIETVRLKFVDERYSMYIALPRQSGFSLKEFLSNLNSNTFDEILNQTTEDYAVSIQLPKVSFKWSKSINEELRKLGIDEIFTRNSNLSDMINTKASISKFMHSADVEINEHGIGVGEPTGIIPRKRFVLYTTKFFHVNRPFFFFIYDHDIESVLFHAAVFDPSQN